MPFLEKEPIRIGPFRLPISRTTDRLVPEGYCLEKPENSWSDTESHGAFYRVVGEDIVEGWYYEEISKDTGFIPPGTEVNKHPYLKKLLHHIPPIIPMPGMG